MEGRDHIKAIRPSVFYHGKFSWVWGCGGFAGSVWPWVIISLFYLYEGGRHVVITVPTIAPLGEICLGEICLGDVPEKSHDGFDMGDSLLENGLDC